MVLLKVCRSIREQTPTTKSDRQHKKCEEVKLLKLYFHLRLAPLPPSLDLF